MKKRKLSSLILIFFTLIGMNAFSATKLYQGLGKTTNLRVGPGKDVYSFNVSVASVVFNEKGEILDVIVDVLDVYSPNIKSDTSAKFSGWPGQEEKNTVESITKEVDNWKTKREKGLDYGMGRKDPDKEWDKQMDSFQKFFKGKTIEELELWFSKSTSDKNGKPLNKENEEDLEKYNKLSDKEKQDLVDLRAGATMSIRDSHGDMLGAIIDAYKNRVEFIID